MRDIEFKAWDKEYKEMTKSYTLQELLSNVLFAKVYKAVGNKYIWLQYTGFKDVNGVKASHKDLIEYDMFYIGDNRKEGGIGIIEWDAGEWGVEKQDGFYICNLCDIINNYGGTIIASSYERKGWRQEGGGINVKY